MSNLSTDCTFFNDDFQNQHARLSQVKVGELLNVSQQAISKLLQAYNLDFSESAEFLSEYGFDGYNLALIVEYYAFDSRQAKLQRKLNDDMPRGYKPLTQHFAPWLIVRVQLSDKCCIIVIEPLV